MEPVAEALRRVEKETLANLSTDIDLLDQVGEYILQSGGKRIRPALLLLGNGIFGEIADQSHTVAGVMEYIHTATLLHDDVVDGAEMRRKKKTANTIWGNEAAVLVGDYLFTISFKLISKFGDMEIVRMLSDCTTMMAKGEILQLIRPFDSSDESEYFAIIEHKTASLMAACTQIGALLGKANREQIEVMRFIGEQIGYAFQILDDVLDYSDRNQKFGKSPCTDLRERKITLPLIHLLNQGAPSFVGKTKRILAGEGIGEDEVEEVREMMLASDSFDYGLAVAKRYSDEALVAIRSLPSNSCRRSLEELVSFMALREF